MGIFKRIGQALTGGQASDKGGYMIYVRCEHCGEGITTRVNLMNDLSLQYGEGGEGNTYFCRKVLMGSSSCFRKIEVSLTFDANRKLLDRQISGGKFITAEEYSEGIA